MAFRLARRLRSTSIAAAVLAAAITVPSVALAAPDSAPAPKPTISSVQKQLAALARENDQLVEQYDKANTAYLASRAAADRARAADRAAAHRLDAAQAQLSASATAEYEGGSFSAAGALLSSDSGSNYLDELDTLSMLDSHNAQIVSSYAATQKQARDAKRHAEQAYAQAVSRRAYLLSKRDQTKHQIATYTALLATLNAQQQAALERAALAKAARGAAATSGGTAPQATSITTQAQVKHVKVAHVSSAAVQKAISFALAQVNKPYVFGAAGPGAYDCSGLTMAAYHAAGINLPHSAADQYNYGHHVSADALQPGDLMFYYQPIGHVTMYLGNGMMISAPQTGEDVKVIPADTTNSYTGATRLVG